jgi:hypothetical protein
MNNNNAPFYPGQKIVCIDDSPSYFDGRPCPLKKNNIYIFESMCDCGCSGNLFIQGYPGYNFSAKRFAPLHYSSITAELAAQVQVGDTQDVKTKEVLCSS